MAELKRVTDAIDELKNFVLAVDQAVEALYDQIKQLTEDGITTAAADALLLQLQGVRDAVAKVQTDDEPEAPPVEPPTGA